jgi:phage tail sheath protein FI
MRASLAPGLYFEAVRPAAAADPLRTDVAGFIGRTQRGPVGVATRVAGWREFQLVFGEIVGDADTSLAVRGYFANGGDVAWVVRLDGQPEAVAAETTWDLTLAAPGGGKIGGWDPLRAGFTATKYRLSASSSGSWGNALRVSARYRRGGLGRAAQLDLTVRAPAQRDEQLVALDPAQLADQVAAASFLIRLTAVDSAKALVPPPLGPNILNWQLPAMCGGKDAVVATADYLTALTLLTDQDEVALVVMPDLLREPGSVDFVSVQAQAAAQADALHDRLVLVDLPPATNGAGAVAWAAGMREQLPGALARAAAAYYPSILVQDPVGGIAQPLRRIAPSGHVAGLISRMDRQRGAQYTPANATLEDTLDVELGFTPSERATLNDAGANLLRCMAGQGIQVWGGRTLLNAPEGRYIAHRRLIHRLVRAVRAVAQPLVFETNGPSLWLALARAATTVLLEAWRAGGLQGDRAEQAFQVRCDASNNPPDQQDLGITLCEISLAPAVPMEFITLRVALSAQGSLDVFEQ